MNSRTGIDLSKPSVQKQVRIKKKLQQQHERSKKEPKAGPASSKDPTLPDGQHEVKDWVALDLGAPFQSPYDPWGHPQSWTINFVSSTGKAFELRFEHFSEIGSMQDFCFDFHCVTGWTKKKLGLIGIPSGQVLDYIENKLEITRRDWITFYQIGADGYTVPVQRDDCEGGFLEFLTSDHQLISQQHGGPRFIFPGLFGWKSCKYVHEIHFLDKKEKGFYEKLGCHDRGRVDYLERFDKKAEGVGKFLKACLEVYIRFCPEKVW
ncbi:unnamed protein product, partial [Heterosigma akashiwo]